MRKAVVVGSINRDIVGYVAHHPRPGETVLASHGALFAGGKGANQAVAIARLGARVAFCGRVGSDVFGSEMRAFLAAEGIDVSAVSVISSAMTGLGLITVDKDGENAITVIPGANHIWEAELPSFDVQPGDVIVCQLEIPLPIVVAAFKQARKQGARTLLNAAPFQPLAAEILSATDILIVNEGELAALCGLPPAAALGDPVRIGCLAKDLAERGPTLILVTLGVNGVVLAAVGAPPLHIPGQHVQARDTTGAGDCFVGAFVAGLLRGEPAHTSAIFANAAAAVSVTREGAATSLPTRADVTRFLSQPH